MGFKLVIVPPNTQPDWPEKIRAAVPDCEVLMFDHSDAAMAAIEDADAAYGTLSPELLRRAKRLRWLQAPAAAPPVGYYYKELIESDVVVTNQREIYNDHIGAHIMAFLLAFARGFHRYIPQQMNRQWEQHRDLDSIVYLPEATALIVGVGGIGGEAARLCAAFGMTVLGVDPRRPEAPPSLKSLHRPESLHDILPEADFVIMTVPHTPQTENMMAAREFRLMKRTAYLINIGRGGCVVLDDLAEAIRSGEIAGAGLDVFQVEPLPADHPLWTLPGVLITPHVAGIGPYLQDRRTELLIDNCVRFNEGRELRNIVDKANWF
ncbi:D-2-hydroxyacid dehydrogenase [Candidatus Entotheonella palauensis]|uniref:D-2-hydroxyacid dehydrogenase n=1 Tax=Candidatus Entotheonella palauensis TaxID=93172 RepID=UPI000B7C9FF8|nr:D-2-hydroxyacid dehydrogenase [Candidatus Entotheonella palauensis]